MLRPLHWNRPGRFLLAFVLAVVAVVCPIHLLAVESSAKKPFFEERPMVVIDPGHGGSDEGAAGPSGSREKDVVLRLAEQVAVLLEDRFQVELTRTGDYGMDLPQRTGTANRYPAALFLSLHTAASQAPHVSGVFFYYHRPIASVAAVTSKKTEITAWENLQDRHREQSRRLAQELARQWKTRFPGDEVTVAGHPLPVLEGADMPAVLVEAGTLTHAADELRLADMEHLKTVAAVLAEGVASFLKAGGAAP
ncbi:MAG: N-acetylmuramoyl-L-alanine amidase [Desulfobacteraceae bacterium]|nr:N-acetylmuramoyl-L-alanine amidase [Desulfobacteraceae bacterium]